MSKPPAERLKELREKRGFETAKAAADAYGWNEVTYRSHESGMRNIPVHAARKYAVAFNSSPAYILGVSSAAGDQSIPKLTITVPVQAVASAGAFRIDYEEYQRGIEVPAVPRADVPSASQYALEIDGPSVNLRIPDGAFAICAPLDKMPGGAKHGALVHVIRQRAGLLEHTVKELHYTAEGRILMPCSSDPRYQDRFWPDAPEDGTEVRIAGVVIGAFVPL
jgi:hypothetical protein